MEKFKALIKSRKFWAAVVGLAMVIVKAYDPHFPFTEEQMTAFVSLLMAYMLGTGLEDLGKQPERSDKAVEGRGGTGGRDA